jgi:molybdopterin-guanine dinucleotide biosynthesis protein MobB
MPRPPMVAVIGRKNAGKTTLTVKLAAELGRRGWRVMTIKHGSHDFSIDPEATDTYRHYHEGGAERVAMASPERFALVSRWEEELSPEEIATRYMSDADVVLCEGFKKSALAKIEIHRAAVHGAPLFDPEGPHASEYVAMVTDVKDFAAGFPVVQLANEGWLTELAELVERVVMRRGVS